jgi:uncharacterized protein (TIGR02001 family)
MSDYNFRGITQTAHHPSVAAYFEPRYNFHDDLQAYVGLSAESILFPNRAAGEMDFYGGIRPIFGKLALDFGAWYYWYPGGECFHNFILGCLPSLPNGNVIRADLSFSEIFGKATYAVNDQFSFGGSGYWSRSVLHSGAEGTFLAGTARYNLPTILPKGIGWFISADVGHWFLGTSDNFRAVPGFPGGIPFKSYTTWDAGLAFTWRQFTLDLRYYDTDLNKGDCNAFTSDHTAIGVFSTPINPRGPGSSWCGATFIAKLSFDLTKNDLKKSEEEENESKAGKPKEKKPEEKKPEEKKPEEKKPEEKKSKEKKPEETKPKGKKSEEKKPEEKKPEEKKPEQKKEKSEEKKPEKKAPTDFAFGAALATEYNIRGISASNHEPSATIYFEPRYNLSDSLGFYGRASVHSVSIGNRAEAVINLYAGVLPTFGNLALDFGYWQRLFPGEECVLPQANSTICIVPPHLDYGEVFGKATYTVDKRLSFGGGAYWSPSVLDSGDPATYVEGTAKYVLPTIHLRPASIGWFLSADVGHWFREGTPYPSYTNWNIGLTFASKPYKFDLRYSDTDKFECDIARTTTSVLGAGLILGGRRTDRCRAAFIAKFSIDLNNDSFKY